MLTEGKGQRGQLRKAIDAYLEVYEGNARQARLACGQRCGAARAGRAEKGSTRPHRGCAAACARHRQANAAGFRRRQGGLLGAWRPPAKPVLHSISRISAELWYRRAVDADDVEPFALASSIRQLKEVWGLNASEGAGKLVLPPLEGDACANRQAGAVHRGSCPASGRRRDAGKDLRRHGLHEPREDSSRPQALRGGRPCRGDDRRRRRHGLCHSRHSARDGWPGATCSSRTITS